jgi:MOSC domain-containing protein YiiM
MARLLSVNVRLPRDIEWKGRTVHTAIWKDPVRGHCRVGRLNLDGDGQGDLAGHGGEQRAIFVYQIESYRYWQERLKRADFVHGQFGENFTIEGLPDDAVCIGDRYQIGSALFEVTQPRVTCYRVGIRMNEPRMPALLTSSGRPGFYMRVLQEGEVDPGDEIVKVGEGKERMTVAEINALLYSPDHPRDRLERALQIEALSPGWRSSFEALLQNESSGNAGLAPEAAAHPASPGFRPLAVTAIDQESADVLSLTMQSPTGQPLPTAMPGQYVVVRLQLNAGGPPLFRSYSLSGPLSTEHYRISVKIEPNGAAGNLPAGACAGGRCSRRQLAARKLHSAVGRAAGGAAQRGNRGNAGSGYPACAGGDTLDTAGLVAVLGSRSGASSLRRRSSPPHARAHARPQLRLLQ